MVPTRETLVTQLLTTYYILTLFAIQVQVKEFQVMVDDNLANLNPLSVGPGPTSTAHLNTLIEVA